MDLAGAMLATAAAVTPVELAICFVRASTEQLPFQFGVFDLVFATMSVRH